jgi:hypothetical protein
MTDFKTSWISRIDFSIPRNFEQYFFRQFRKNKRRQCIAMQWTKQKVSRGFTIIQRQSGTGILNGKELKKKEINDKGK